MVTDSQDIAGHTSRLFHKINLHNLQKLNLHTTNCVSWAPDISEFFDQSKEIRQMHAVSMLKLRNTVQMKHVRICELGTTVVLTTAV
jgi:hypothetical protein